MLTDELEHRISVGNLARLLRKVSKDCMLQTNAMRHLGILDAQGVYLGFIDLESETVEYLKDVESDAI